MQQSSLLDQARAGLSSLPDSVVAAEDPPGLLACLLPDWEVLDSVAIASSAVTLLRQRTAPNSTSDGTVGDPDGTGRGWALVSLPTLGDFPDDLLAGDPAADPTDYYTTVRWEDAAVGQRRTLFDRQHRTWVVGADLMGLWQRLASAYDCLQYGREVAPGAVEWEQWMAVGWRLSMQHPDGAALRQQDWVRMMLGFASQSDLESYAWTEAEQVLRSSVFDFAFASVGTRTRAENQHRPLRFGHVQAIHDTVYDRLVEDYFYEALHETHEEVSARTPENDAARTLHDYPSPTEVDRAVHDVLDTLDWRSLDNPRVHRGR